MTDHVLDFVPPLANGLPVASFVMTFTTVHGIGAMYTDAATRVWTDAQDVVENFAAQRAEPSEFAVDSAVSPSVVLGGKPHDGLADRGG